MKNESLIDHLIYKLYKTPITHDIGCKDGGGGSQYTKESEVGIYLV
jgi:hypothetical protein